MPSWRIGLVAAVLLLVAGIWLAVTTEQKTITSFTSFTAQPLPANELAWNNSFCTALEEGVKIEQGAQLSQSVKSEAIIIEVGYFLWFDEAALIVQSQPASNYWDLRIVVTALEKRIKELEQ